MWLTVVACAWFTVQPARACPPPLADAGTVLEDSGDATSYAFARLAVCGWDEAEPVFRAALEWPDDSGQRDAEAGQLLVLALASAPQDTVRVLVDAEEQHDADDWLQAYRLPAGEMDRAVQRIDDALPQLVALVRTIQPKNDDMTVLAELVLARRDLFHADLAAAERRLALLQTQPVQADERGEWRDFVDELRAALRDESPAADSAPAHWTLQPQERPTCGMGMLMSGLKPTSWRVAAAAARHGQDAAIRVLLQEEWVGLIQGDADHVDELVTRLRARYTPAELRREWDDVEASVHRDGDRGMVRLFDIDLPLPESEQCGLSSVARCSGDPPSGLRPLDEARWRELLRETKLYHALFDASDASS